MGPLSGCQFGSFGLEHQLSVSCIKRPSILFSPWNSSLTHSTSDREETIQEVSHRQHCSHSLLCAHMWKSSQMHLRGRERVGGRSCSMKETLHFCWMKMRHWLEVSQRNNPSRVKKNPLFHPFVSFCCFACVHNMES